MFLPAYAALELKGGQLVMGLKDILMPSGVLTAPAVDDKKRLLAYLSEAAAQQTGLRAREIYHALMQRERLGSTGIGRGIAIPHGRVSDLDRIVCLFTRLDRPLPYESIDGAPVDLVFVLLAPEHAGAEHLKALARLSRMLRDPRTLDLLRATREPSALYAILAEEAALKVAS